MRKSLFLSLFVAQFIWAADSLSIPTNQQIKNDRIQSLEREFARLEKELQTQKAQLELLKKSATGDFDTDARIIIENFSSVGSNYRLLDARFYLDDQEVGFVTAEDASKPVVFDGFLKEGKHSIKIEKRYTPNNKIFTYMNNQLYAVSGNVDAILKPGNTTYVDVTARETDKKDPIDLQYDVKVIPRGETGRSPLPVSQMPHLVSGTKSVDTNLVIFASKELEPNFKVVDQELFLDGKKLKNAPAGTEGRLGLILSEGPIPSGEHKLEAKVYFEGEKKPKFTVRYQLKFTTQPGFKTSLILTDNQKIKVNQEAL